VRDLAGQGRVVDEIDYMVFTTSQLASGTESAGRHDGWIIDVSPLPPQVVVVVDPMTLLSAQGVPGLCSPYQLPRHVDDGGSPSDLSTAVWGLYNVYRYRAARLEPEQPARFPGTMSAAR
jgi:hypothetical protein